MTIDEIKKALREALEDKRYTGYALDKHGNYTPDLVAMEYSYGEFMKIKAEIDAMFQVYQNPFYWLRLSKEFNDVDYQNDDD